MSYVKQNFVKGQVLKADHLNHMENGIVSAMEQSGPVVGIPGAAGDGETDDTAALTAALSQSNRVVDGGNKRYKYGVLEIEGVENLTVQNIIFHQGETVNVKGCKNVRFVHCRWEGIRAASAESTTQTCGIRLMERKDENETEIWCENVWIEHCVFDDIDFNHNINIKNGVRLGNQISGQAILPRSVHNLFVKHCIFTQTKGNAAIHWNTPRKCGYAEITDNLFYLTGFGGVCVYAIQQQYPKMTGKISDNQFIGCGLGYQDPEWLNSLPEKDRGVGCAALLGGAGVNAAPYKWHMAVENNVFEDCCESSIEGPTWNPVIGNSCSGQGTLQDEENCRKMEQKYHLPYKLQVRYNPSVNFIYRNYYKDVGGSYPNDDNDPIVFQHNVMGNAYVDRSSFILLRGDYNCPVVFTDNTMEITDKGLLYMHVLFSTFRKGFRFENNHGIRPYLNQSTFKGNVIMDELNSAWGCDFSEANFVPNQSRSRFPELNAPLYDPARMVLENDQAKTVDGRPVLTSYDIPETVEKPTDTAYDITSADGYTEENGYVFGGPSAANRIDTGIQLLKDGGDFTIFLQFDGNTTTAIGSSDGGIMPLFTVYDKSTDSYRMTLGGRWGNNNVHLKVNKNSVSVKQAPLVMQQMQLLLRRKGSTIQCWAMKRGTAAADLTENLAEVQITEADALPGFEGSLYIGTPEGYSGESNEKYALLGKMKEFQVFSRALSDDEASLLLYDKIFESGSESQAPIPVYDIATDEHYSSEDSAVTFDGSFGIDTGVQLFKDGGDWTVISRFRLESYHDARLTNFNFIPVLSAINYTQSDDFKTKSPGFDIGLSLQDGDNMETVATGGFVTFRNSWKLSGWAYVLNSYFGYCDQDIGVIVIRKNGVISVYDFNMQRLATLSGADATTTFDGTLHIGENMVAPPLAGNNKLKGKVYECKVYDKALSTSTLEQMFPNIYSNEVRTKGAVTCRIPNPQYKTQLIRYLFLEAVIDMGKYSAPEYAGKYLKAVGIRVDGVPDIIWCQTGSNTHVRKVFYAPKYIGPYDSISARIVNTGLAPDLQATVKAFRCALLTEEQAVTDASDALDFAVEWDKEEMAIAVGEVLTGHVTYLPEDANSGTSLTMTADSDAATVAIKDETIAVTGAKNGEVNIEAVLPYGTKKVFTVKVGTGASDESR